MANVSPDPSQLALWTLRRFVTYAAVGACAFAVDYSVFLVLLAAGAGPYIGNVVGIAAGITVSFTLNRRYNFRKLDIVRRRAAKFIGVALLGMALSSLVIMLLIAHGIDARIAKAVAMFFVFGMQFLANTFWTFR